MLQTVAIWYVIVLSGDQRSAPGKWGRPRNGSSSFQPDFNQIPAQNPVANLVEITRNHVFSGVPEVP